MKRNTIVIIILAAMAFATTAQLADAASTKAPKPLKGKVVSLDDIIKGKKTADLQLTKERAAELLKNGSPLVFLYNKKVYFVQNEGGNFAFARLADFAHRTVVGITGKTKTVSGINYIIMSNIEAMD